MEIQFPTPIEAFIDYRTFVEDQVAPARSNEELAEFLYASSFRGLTPELAATVKNCVAEEWDVKSENCIIVGSARLGFSPVDKPSTPMRESKSAGRPFCDASDIDIAVISEQKFDEIWEQLFRAFPHYRSWPDLSSFRKYMYRGWLRPDKMPFKFFGRKAWFDKCNLISKKAIDSTLVVSIALYKSEFFFQEAMGTSAHTIRSRLAE